MTIECSIIESFYQTLINNANLQKYCEKKDIYRGVQKPEQNISKNSVIIEPHNFNVTLNQYISKTETIRQFDFDVVLCVTYTEGTQQNELQRFLEMESFVINAIDSSTYISANSVIKRAELISIEREFIVDRLLVRLSDVKYTISGDYVTGNH